MHGRELVTFLEHFMSRKYKPLLFELSLKRTTKTIGLLLLNCKNWYKIVILESIRTRLLNVGSTSIEYNKLITDTSVMYNQSSSLHCTDVLHCIYRRLYLRMIVPIIIHLIICVLTNFWIINYFKNI
jgi:hypothetical protein